MVVVTGVPATDDPPPLAGDAAAPILPGVEWEVRVSAFLCLLDEGDDTGMVAAVQVSVTGHSSDLITRFVTIGGGGTVADDVIGG